jgi:hypothetical protein
MYKRLQVLPQPDQRMKAMGIMQTGLLGLHILSTLHRKPALSVDCVEKMR